MRVLYGVNVNNNNTFCSVDELLFIFVSINGNAI